MTQKVPLGIVSMRLNDLLSTPFDTHIINYEPSRGLVVLKFTMYNGTSEPFDHLVYYRQVMTLNVGDDVLLCKVFPSMVCTTLHYHGFTGYYRTFLVALEISLKFLLCIAYALLDKSIIYVHCKT